MSLPPLPPGPQARDVRRLQPDPQLDRPTSHAALDSEDALFQESRNVARALLERVEQLRDGQREAGG
jgi:hypothetical protein